MVLLESDVRIVRLGFRSREQNERCVFARVPMSEAQELLSDPKTLKRGVHRQIGQVGAIGVVGQCSGDTDQQAVGGSSCDNNVRVTKHPFNCFEIVNRSTFGQRRSPEHIDEFFRWKIDFDAVMMLFGAAHALLPRVIGKTAKVIKIGLHPVTVHILTFELVRQPTFRIR